MEKDRIDKIKKTVNENTNEAVYEDMRRWTSLTLHDLFACPTYLCHKKDLSKEEIAEENEKQMGKIRDYLNATYKRVELLHYIILALLDKEKEKK